jgi:spore maturation protein CgeB
MHFVVFCHSLVSDWNHGNAHFLRGIVTELGSLGHTVDVYEPEDGWSRRNLREDQGEAALVAFRQRFPHLHSKRYRPEGPSLDRALADADVVLVHEWTDPALVAAIGAHRETHGHYRLLYHDTHHRAVSDRAAWESLDLRGYDAALVFGGALAEVYRQRAEIPRVYVWHEAADVRVFHPEARAGGGHATPSPWTSTPPVSDLVWIGNWGDDERTAELEEFLLEPIHELGLSAAIYGVRYPEAARAALERAGAVYHGYLPNHAVPAAFARARLTIHVPRRYYAQSLPGIPTIRPFEALACGIPLISAPWDDREHLFEPGKDFLFARSGREMTEHIRALLSDPARARAQAEHGRATVLARHTCAHRVGELMSILRELALQEAA